MTIIPRVAACIACLLLAGVAAEPIEAAVCVPLRGFAQELHDEFTFTLTEQIRQGEALIFSIRPIPYSSISSSPDTYINAKINASYTNLGQPVVTQSDRYGVLQITSIDTGSKVVIRIINLRPDGSTPFELNSYYANNAESCRIMLDPQRAFVSVTPSHLWSPDIPAKMYLMAAPPRGSTSFKVTTLGTNAAMYYSHAKTDQGQSLASGQSAAWTSSDPVCFTLVPPNNDVATRIVRISIEWSNAPLPPDDYTPQQPSSPIRAPTTSTAPTPAGSNAVAKAATWSAPSLFAVLIIAYFAVRSIYNYRQLGINTFPEFVPHHEFFSSLFRAVGAVASNLRARGSAVVFRRGGYQEVNRAEHPS